jgi:HlyD family secretion protein
MGIVPSADRLIVDARFAPSDIDQVAVGSSVAVRVNAGNRRTTPEFAGRITQVSPDLSRDAQTNAPYFSVRVALADAPGQDSDGLKLMPGMQAEVFAATDERTPFEYLLKPLTEQILRTFRER